MNDERLTDELAARVMGWKPGPDTLAVARALGLEAER
jgi:hypothetical protein